MFNAGLAHRNVFFTFGNVWEGRESRPFTCFQSCRSFSWCCPSSLLAVSCTCRFQTSGPPCNRRALSCFRSCCPAQITFYKVLDLNCFVSSDSCSSFLADSRSFPSSSSSTVISASIPTCVRQIEFKVVFFQGSTSLSSTGSTMISGISVIASPEQEEEEEETT